MKLLLLYCTRFELATASKSLPGAEDDERAESHDDCVVALVHAEPADEASAGGVETKLVKNAKWLAGKFDTKIIVFHFFSHLGSETARPEFARDLVTRAAGRLRGSGYEAHVMPFGYFCSLRLDVAGPSLAKVFKEI